MGYATPVLSTVLLFVSGERLTETALIGGTIVVVACAMAGLTMDDRTTDREPA